MYEAYGYVNNSMDLPVYTIQIDLQHNDNYLFYFKLQTHTFWSISNIVYKVRLEESCTGCSEIPLK